MSDPKEQSFAALLSMVKKAKSDNERFAALLVIAKTTKSDSLSTDDRRDLFNTIGIEFPARLLATSYSNISDNSPIFASIGAAVLSAFCTDDATVKKPEFTSTITPLLKTVEFFKDSKESSGTVNDCLDCLTILAEHESYIQKILENDVVGILCAADKIYEDKTCDILISLLKSAEIWRKEEVVLLELLDRMSADFRDDRSGRKLKLCGYFFHFLSSVPADLHHDSLPRSTKENILHGLQEIVVSKISSDQRNAALLLSSEVLRVFGVSSFYCQKLIPNFFIIVVRLACIEVGVYFRNFKPEESIKAQATESSMKLLVACCFLIEAACSCVAQFENAETGSLADILTFEQIKLLQPALSDVATCVASHISVLMMRNITELSRQEMLHLKLIVSFLRSWLAVENHMTSPQGSEIMAAIIRAIKYFVKSRDVESIKNILPSVTMGLDYANTRKTILGSNILETLNNALKCALNHNDSIHQEALHLTVQALIGLCTASRSDNNHLDQETLQESLSMVLNANQEAENIETTAHLCSFCAVLLNELSLDDDVVRDKEIHALHTTIAFLRTFCGVSEQSGQIKIADSCLDCRSDICQLWTLCAQEIAGSSGRHKWVRDSLVSSKWQEEIPALIKSARKTESHEQIATVLSNLLKAIK